MQGYITQVGWNYFDGTKYPLFGSDVKAVSDNDALFCQFVAHQGQAVKLTPKTQDEKKGKLYLVKFPN